MADLIRVKRGLKENLPPLMVAEFGWADDTEQLFIGATSGNVPISKTGNYINVKDFGAIGNGIVDDTAAIQRAFHASGSKTSRNYIFIPAGNYRVSSLVNPASLCIIGEREQTVLIGIDGTLPILDFPNDFSHVEIANLKFTRLTIPLKNSGASAIVFRQTGYNFNIHDLHITNQDYGINMIGNTAGGWIDKCFIENCVNYGFKLDHYNSTISNCHVNHNDESGYYFSSTNGCFLHKCEAYRCKGSGFKFRGNALNPMNNIIANQCVVSVCNSNGFDIDSFGGNHQFVNCFIEYAGFSDEGTTIVNEYASGIFLSGNNHNSEFVCINSCFNASHGFYSLTGSFKINGGSYFANGLGGSGYGVYLPNKSDNFIISNATFNRPLTANTQSFAINIENANSENFIISLNDFKNQKTGGISNASSNGIVNNNLDISI